MSGSEQTQLLLAAEWLAQHRDLVADIADSFLSTGVWPSRQYLGRTALREASEDVFEVLRGIPGPVGWLDADDRVCLRVRGLAVSSNAGSVLHEFMRVLRLAELRLLSGQPEPKVTSHDLTGPALGIPEANARLVGEIVLAEDWMFNGGSGDVTHGWERNVNERTRFIAGLHGIDDYLRAEGALMWSGPAPRQASSWTKPAHVVVQFDALHPLIVEAAAQEFAREDYPRAVRAAWFALRDLVRQRLDAPDLDGVALMERIGAGQPALALTPLATDSDWSMHRGLWNYLVGTAHFVRNPEMHESVSPVAGDRIGAFERLAIMSLCARFVEAAASPLAVEQAVEEASQASFAATDAAADDLVHSIATAQRPRLVAALLDAVLVAEKAGETERARNLRAVYRRALRRLPADDPSVRTSLQRVRGLIVDDGTLPVAIDLLTPLLLESLEVRYRDKVARAIAQAITTGQPRTAQAAPLRASEVTPRLFVALTATGRTEVLDAIIQGLGQSQEQQVSAARVVMAIGAALTNEEAMRVAVALAQTIIDEGPSIMAREVERALPAMPEVLRRQLHVHLVMAYEDAPGRKIADSMLAELRDS